MAPIRVVYEGDIDALLADQGRGHLGAYLPTTGKGMIAAGLGRYWLVSLESLELQAIRFDESAPPDPLRLSGAELVIGPKHRGLLVLGDLAIGGDALLDLGDNSPALIVEGALRAKALELGDNMVYVRHDFVCDSVRAHGAGLAIVEGGIQVMSWEGQDFTVECADPGWADHFSVNVRSLA